MKKLRRPAQERKPKRHRKKAIPRTPREWDDHYQELAHFYESDFSLEVMNKGIAVPSATLRQVKKQKAKSISIRMPLLDLIGVKRIAAKKDQPYQKLIIQAVEKWIDEEEQKERIQPARNRKKAG